VAEMIWCGLGVLVAALCRATGFPIWLALSVVFFARLLSLP
jgi:hypothetical protein